MSVTLTITNEILKVDYQDIVRDVMNSAVVLNARLERDWDSVQGEMVYFGLNVSRNKSFASRHGTGTYLPPSGAQGYDATTFDIPEMYGRLQVSQRDIKASRNSKGALLRVLDSEVKNYIRDCKVALNRMNYGDGSGIVARVLFGSSPTATTFEVAVEHQHGNTPTYGTTATYHATRFLEPGTFITFGDDKPGNTPVMRTAGALGPDNSTRYCRVVSANRTTGVVTVDNLSGNSLTAGGVVADDFVYIYGSVGTDQMGLLGIVDDGQTSRANERFLDSLQSIDRTDAAKNWWNANVLHNSGTLRNISLQLLQDLCDEIEIQGDGMVNLMLTTYGIRSAILALLIADKRFSAPFEMELDGGFRSLSYNGIPIVPDKDAPKHMLFGLDESTLKFYSMSDMEWLEEDGSVLHRVPDEPKYEATGFLYREMGVTDPRNCGKIEDLVDTTNL